MASRKEYEMLFRLNAQLGGNYSSTFKSAQDSIASMQKEMTSLSKAQSDISAYEKQQNAVEASRKKLESLQQQYDNIQREISETGEFSSVLENKLLSKQQQIDRTAASLSSQTAKLDQMGNSLREAGVDTENLTGESAKLGQQIDEIKVKQEEAADGADNFGTKASAAFSAVEQAIIAAGIAVALKEIADMYSDAIEASMEFESAMTGVAKTTDMSAEELAAMSSEIKDLSTEIPIVTEELAGIGETAGQLGIAKNDILDFSEVMAMLATATTMTAEEGATMLAQFANITRMDPKYYSNLASTIVDLGNNFATTEQKITNMSQGIAASASLAGMSEADMVALSTAVTSLGIETQAGATSMSKLISELMTAVETGEKLDEFATIANMSAQEFSQVWGNNAVDALQAFVLGLSDTERNGKSATVALTELGITETRMQRMVLSLANSGDLLNRTLDTSSKAWSENTALVKEAELRYGTSHSQLTMMENAYNNLKIAVGDNFTPELRELYGVGTDVISSITKFVEKNPELVKGVTAFVGVIGLAVGGITAYAAIVKVAIPLTAAFTAAMPGVNVIMGVVAGYAALTAGIVAYAESIKTSEEDLHKLTATSRAEYYQLEDMRKEYERVCTVMGDTSAEAQLLKSKLDDATEAFQKNKQTSEELVASHREIIEAHNELMAVYSETIDGINEEATSNDNLIKKLEDLMLVENKTTETKQELLAVVDLLNEAMPELGLAYDQNADSLNMNAKAIRSVIEAEIEREKNAANYKQLKDLISEESGLYEKLQSQIKETAAAEKELVDAQIAEAAIREELGNVSGEAGGRLYAQKIMPYVLAVNTATEAVSEATEAERQAQDAYNENQSAIHELSSALAEYSNEIETSSGNMQEVISSIRTQMEELAEAYEEAYLAAIESVSGQYELWDKAKEVVSTSAQEINKALESQTEYWQDYNANLGTLTERSADIEGLAEMIASFADGSEGSVNAIAGMANATDEELSAMVSNWQDLQKEQETVASSLAGIEIEFSETMANLQLELETSIAEMDLGNEAAESGKSTIQGFINGAQDMLPELQAAYSRIARAAVAAIDEQLDINSPSRVLELRGEYAMAGFVGGVSSMKPNVEAAMADVASAGTDALTTETISAIPDNSRYGGGVAPTFQFSYDFTGANVGSVPELQSMLESRDANIIDIINDVLDNREIDSSRRAYL